MGPAVVGAAELGSAVVGAGVGPAVVGAAVALAVASTPSARRAAGAGSLFVANSAATSTRRRMIAAPGVSTQPAA